MAFVVEDGTGREDSNAYYSPDSVRAYAYDRNMEVLVSLEDKQLSANIIIASFFLDSYFSWKGEKSHESQGLEFPRTGIRKKTGGNFPPSSIPTCFLAAISYLSLPKVNSQLIQIPDPHSEQNIKRLLYQIDGNTTKDITYAAPGELIKKESVPYLRQVVWDWLYQSDSSFLGSVIATGIPRCWNGYNISI